MYSVNAMCFKCRYSASGVQLTGSSPQSQVEGEILEAMQRLKEAVGRHEACRTEPELLQSFTEIIEVGRHCDYHMTVTWEIIEVESAL